MTEFEYVASGLADCVTHEIEQLLIESDRKNPNTKPKTFRKGGR